MTKPLYAILAFLLFTQAANAQQFKNGDLEPLKSGLTTCADNGVAPYDSDMGYSWMAGPLSHVLIADSNCTAGQPFSGNHYIGLEYNSAGDYLVFALDRPMVAGTPYTFEFYYKLELGKNPCPLYFGYSHTSNALDTLVTNIVAPSTNAWTYDSVTFTPLASASYIWLGADIPLPAYTGVTYIDGLHMKGIPRLAVNHLQVSNSINIHPNPFSGYTEIDIDASVALPYNISVYDVTGRMVLQKQNISTLKTTLNKSDIGSGMYFVKITDANRNSYCAKLVAE